MEKKTREKKNSNFTQECSMRGRTVKNITGKQYGKVVAYYSCELV